MGLWDTNTKGVFGITDIVNFLTIMKRTTVQNLLIQIVFPVPVVTRVCCVLTRKYLTSVKKLPRTNNLAYLSNEGYLFTINVKNFFFSCLTEKAEVF